MITDSFDPITRPLIALSDFYGEKKHMLDVCLITFSRVISENLLSAYKCEKIAEIRAVNGTIPIYMLEHRGKKVAFYLSALGSTGASQCAIEANWLTGASKFIMFGSAGSLDGEKTKNRFVIPAEAYRDEGMSYHYAPPGDYIKIKNSVRVKEIFEDLALPYVEGRVWTTEAMLMETAGLTALRRREGCIAVEMEVAGVQAVSDYYGFDLYDFLVTGDVLSENDYTVGTLTDANHNLDKLRIALEMAIRL